MDLLERAGVTRQEREVLALVGKRLTNDEIADRLYISVRTVESHVSALLTKLGVENRLALGALESSLGKELRGFPLARTSLIGREFELAEVTQRLSKSRLVTLTGVGGTGKTRLGVEAAKRAAERFEDGAVFVDLTALADPELIAPTIARELGLPGLDIAVDGNGSREDEVVAYLAQVELLIVLDNCEHLLEACARLADRVLDECDRVKVLATSREALAVHGESVFAVPPLELPGEELVAAESDAVRLLVERADAVRAGLDLLGKHESAAVEICRRLDGIPLAIELAAAQLTHLTPEEVAVRLHDRFKLLSGGRRDQRHATLQAAIGWSYDLLTEPERALLAQLGVFRGGFSLEAVEGICEVEAVRRDQLADLVASLVRKSLVVTTIADRSSRYGLLETIRVFATERLIELGKLEALRMRHGEWFTGWTEHLDRDRIVLPAWRPLSDLRALDREHDNLRAALAWAQPQGRFELVARMTVSSDILWHATLGNPDEGVKWVKTALGEDLAPDLRVRCLILDTMLALWQGNLFELPEKSNRALAALEEAGLTNEPEATGIFFVTGVIRAYVGDETGRTLIGRGRELADKLSIASAKHAADFYEAALCLYEGNLDKACDVYACFVPGVNLEDPAFFDAGGLAEAAAAAHLTGHADLVSMIVQQLDALREIQDEPWAQMSIEVGLAIAHLSRGAHDTALEELIQTVEWVSRLNMPLATNYVLTMVAAALSLQGNDEDASRILAASAPGPLAIRTSGQLVIFRHYERHIQARLGDDTTSKLRAEGAAMSLQEAAELAKQIAAGNRVQRTRRVHTFMFTDIVDSTRLVDVLGDEAWDDLVSWHDRTLRSLFSEHGGEEVDHSGDGFFVAFPQADNALECARAIQRTLAEHRRDHGFGPNLRIGIHTTEANERGGNFIGKGVHVAARVGADASGGEILASRATLEASRASTPTSSPRSVELKGLSDPLEVVTIDWLAR